MNNDYISYLDSIAVSLRGIYDCMVEIKTELAELNRPSSMMMPEVFVGGDAWCALYGCDLQEGVAGFGNTPAEAIEDFNKNWYKVTPEMMKEKLK